MNNFQYSLGVTVVITVSGESGQVISRLDQIYGGNQYQVHYKAADGRAVTEWFPEELLHQTKKAPSDRQLDNAS